MRVSFNSLAAKSVVSTLTFAVSFFVATTVQAAVVPVVSGTVTYPGGAPASGITVEFHNGNASESATDVTDGSGNYSISYEENDIDGENMTVEPRVPDGYNRPANSPVNFTYQSGDDERTVDFEFVQAPKEINITVTTIDGNPVETVQVVAQPVEPGTQASDDFADGIGTLNVTGGKWVVKADANLSDQNPERFQWMAIGGSQIVEFSDDDSAESVDLEFQVVPTDTKMTIKPVDADGQKLTGNSFTGDVFIDCYSAEYGAFSTSRKVNPTTGEFSVYVLPSVCTVSAYHPQLTGQSFSASDATVVIPDTGGEIDFGTIQAVENAGEIGGSVIESGKSGSSLLARLFKSTSAVSNIRVVATNITNHETFSTNTNSEGDFSLMNLSAGEYSVSIESDNQVLLQGQQVTLESANSANTDVELTVAELDYTITGTLKLNGTAVTDFQGTVEAQANGKTFSSAVDASGRYTIRYASSLAPASNVNLKVIPQVGDEVYATVVSVTLGAQSTVNKDITLGNDEAEISGRLVDQNGGAATSGQFGKASVQAIHTGTGAVETTPVNDNGTYTLSVGPGKWTIVPKLEAVSEEIVIADKSNVEVEVAAGESRTGINVTVHETVGDVSGTVRESDGSAAAGVPVIATNLPALQAAGGVDPSDIITVATQTDSNGNYSMPLPVGTFEVTYATTPDLTNQINPVSDTVTITNNANVDADGQFRAANRTVTGTVKGNVESDSLVFYSDAGGTREADVQADGTYSVQLADGAWEAVASGVKNDQLWVAEKAVAVDGAESFDFNLHSTGVVVPGSVYTTGQADETIVASNAAGASVVLPPFSADVSGEVTVELSPDPTVQFSNGVAQIGLAYDITVTDGSGFPVTQLDQPATITLPVDESLLGGKKSAQMMPATYSDDFDSYVSNGLTAETKGDEVVIYSDHFSRFAMTSSNTKKIAVVPFKKVPKAKAKEVASHQAKITWKKPKGFAVGRYVLQVRKNDDANKAAWKKYQKVRKLNKIVKNLDSGTAYEFRVKACNVAGCGKFTKWNDFSTL